MKNSKIFIFFLFVLLFCISALAYGEERLLWDIKLGDMITASPAVYDKYLYVRTDSDYLYVLDAKTGTIKKKYKTGNVEEASPLIVNDTLYLGERKGKDLYMKVFDLKTETVLWEKKLGEYEFMFTPSLKEDLLYIPLSTETEGEVYALSKTDGKLIWSFKVDAPIYSPVSVGDDTVYIPTEKGILLAVSSVNGKLKWNFFTTGAKGSLPSKYVGISATPGICGNTLYVGADDTYFYAIDKDTGRLKWKYKTWGNIISSPAISNDTIYMASKDGFVYTLSQNGELKWEYETGYSIFSSPIISGNTLYIGDTNGGIHAIDVNTGKRKWRLDRDPNFPNSISSSLILVDGILYGGDMGGYIFAISTGEKGHNWPMFMYNSAHTGCIIDK